MDARTTMGASLFNPFSRERYLLWTPLLPAECEARLDDRFIVDPYKRYGWTRGPLEQYPIVGEAWPHEFSIRKRLRWRGGVGSCQTVASGRMERASGGTVIFLRLGHDRGEALFETGFILLPLLLGLAEAAFSGFEPLATAHGLIPGAFVSLVLLLVMGAFHVAARWRSGDEGEWLLKFLYETLDAAELPPGTTVRRRRAAS